MSAFSDYTVNVIFDNRKKQKIRRNFSIISDPNNGVSEIRGFLFWRNEFWIPCFRRSRFWNLKAVFQKEKLLQKFLIKLLKCLHFILQNSRKFLWINPKIKYLVDKTFFWFSSIVWIWRGKLLITSLFLLFLHHSFLLSTF